MREKICIMNVLAHGHTHTHAPTEALVEWTDTEEIVDSVSQKN